MENRRRFLQQSGLAASALLLTKPSNAMSAIGSQFGFIQNNNLLLLHTGDAFITACNSAVLPGLQGSAKAGEYITAIKKKNKHAVLLHAGKCHPAGKNPDVKLTQFGYDVDIAENNVGEYSIVQKGNIRTGIINANSRNAGNTGDSDDIVAKISALAKKLKKEKQCQMVVCLSQLGYKNHHALDDKSLAGLSEHIDVIIGGNEANSQPHPRVVLNRHNEEVIIHYGLQKANGIGSIEIGFDELGKKNHIAFNAKIS